MDMKIIKKKGRWGTIHFEIEGLNKGDYQLCNNKTFDSEKDAEEYLEKLSIKKWEIDREKELW